MSTGEGEPKKKKETNGLCKLDLTDTSIPILSGKGANWTYSHDCDSILLYPNEKFHHPSRSNLMNYINEYIST